MVFGDNGNSCCLFFRRISDLCIVCFVILWCFVLLMIFVLLESGCLVGFGLLNKFVCIFIWRIWVIVLLIWFCVILLFLICLIKFLYNGFYVFVGIIYILRFVLVVCV